MNGQVNAEGSSSLAQNPYPNVGQASELQPPIEAINTAQQNASAAASASEQSVPEVPVKRPRGRPKGSTNKKRDTDEEPPAGKRHVGRPRKDGLPPGSAPDSKTKRPQQHTVEPKPVATKAKAPSVSVSAPAPVANGTRSRPVKDAWSALSHPSFLSALLSFLDESEPFALPSPSASVNASMSPESSFKTHLTSLTPLPNQSAPELYLTLQTFWLPSSPAYFSFISRSTTRQSYHRFFYWDPLPLVFNLQCPDCSSTLVHNGRIESGPIAIYDLQFSFYIIGASYLCNSTSCHSKKFSSTDPAILAALPAAMLSEFPAVLVPTDTVISKGRNGKGKETDYGVWSWGAWGVSRQLWNVAISLAQAGLMKDEITEALESAKKGTPFEDDQLRYPEEPAPSTNQHVVNAWRAHGQQTVPSPNLQATTVSTFPPIATQASPTLSAALSQTQTTGSPAASQPQPQQHQHQPQVSFIHYQPPQQSVQQYQSTTPASTWHHQGPNQQPYTSYYMGFMAPSTPATQAAAAAAASNGPGSATTAAGQDAAGIKRPAPAVGDTGGEQVDKKPRME